MLNDFLWAFAQGLMEVAVPIIVVAVISLAATYIKLGLAKLQEKAPAVYKALMMASALAVRAAEQTGLDSAVKKEQAVAFAQSLLNGQGIKLDVGDIAEAIEAAVFEMNGENKDELFIEVAPGEFEKAVDGPMA